MQCLDSRDLYLEQCCIDARGWNVQEEGQRRPDRRLFCCESSYEGLARQVSLRGLARNVVTYPYTLIILRDVDQVGFSISRAASVDDGGLDFLRSVCLARVLFHDRSQAVPLRAKATRERRRRV